MEGLIQELKELEELVMQCMKCGTCQAYCPLYQKDFIESSVARGKISLIESMYDGRLDETSRILKYIDYCLLCGRCKHNCPSGVQTDDIFLQAKFILRKIEKMPSWQKVILNIVMKKPEMMAKLAPLMHMGIKFGSKKIKDKVFKPLIGTFSQRNIIAIQKKPFCSTYGGFHQAKNERMKIIFYPGCATNMMMTYWGEAVLKVLKHYHISVYIPKVNKCCGIPAATMGDNLLYKKMVEENYTYFDTFTDADYVITCCPTCQYGLSDMGGKVSSINSNKKYIDILVFLKEVVNIETQISLDEKTSLHIPCHYDPSKIDLLNEFVTENIKSDFSSLDNLGCCGFGGTFNIKHYQDSKMIAKSKVDELKEKEITKLFTPCPGCAMQLIDMTLAEDVFIDVTHPVVLLAEEIS